MSSCCVPFCNSNKKRDQITMHEFPFDFELRKKWLINIARKDFVPSDYTLVCSKHFRSEDYSISVLKRKRLIPGAVPTVFDNYPSYMIPIHKKYRQQMTKKGFDIKSNRNYKVGRPVQYKPTCDVAVSEKCSNAVIGETWINTVKYKQTDMCKTYSKIDVCKTNNNTDICKMNNNTDMDETNNYTDICKTNSVTYMCEKNSVTDMCEMNSVTDMHETTSVTDMCEMNSVTDLCETNSVTDLCETNSVTDLCGTNSVTDLCEMNSVTDLCETNSITDVCETNSITDVCETNSITDVCETNSVIDMCETNSVIDMCESGDTIKRKSSYDTIHGKYCNKATQTKVRFSRTKKQNKTINQLRKLLLARDKEILCLKLKAKKLSNKLDYYINNEYFSNFEKINILNGESSCS